MLWECPKVWPVRTILKFNSSIDESKVKSAVSPLKLIVELEGIFIFPNDSNNTLPDKIEDFVLTSLNEVSFITESIRAMILEIPSLSPLCPASTVKQGQREEK